MTRNFILTLSIGLLCLFAGCSTHAQAPQYAGVETGTGAPPPAAPQDMRLGNAYVSALGEECYELIPVAAPFESSRAMCLRGGQWEVLSPVLTNLPGTASAR